MQGYSQLVPATLNEPRLLPADQQNAMVEQMWNHQKKMSDLDADNLDALNLRWIEQVQRDPAAAAITSLDDLLQMRGLQPRLGGSGIRGGFRDEQRKETLWSCACLQSLFVQVDLEPRKPWKKNTKAVRSRVITITNLYGQSRLLDQDLDVHSFVHRPGEYFAQFLLGSRQTALLSVKALSYDRYRQVWEKRLARYLTWIWRIRAGDKSYLQPHRITTLLEAIGEASIASGREEPMSG